MMIAHHGLPPGIRFVRPLGRPVEDREVWHAETAEGVPVAVKLVNNPWTIQRLPWLSATIDRLQASGYPVPRVLWHAPLGEGWFGLVLNPESKWPYRPAVVFGEVWAMPRDGQSSMVGACGEPAVRR